MGPFGKREASKAPATDANQEHPAEEPIGGRPGKPPSSDGPDRDTPSGDRTDSTEQRKAKQMYMDELAHLHWAALVAECFGFEETARAFQAMQADLSRQMTQRVVPTSNDEDV